MIVENDDDDDDDNGTTVSFRGGEVLINGEPEGEVPDTSTGTAPTGTTKLVRMTLGQLQRFQKTVVVEVPQHYTDDDVKRCARHVYDLDDGDDFEPDVEWGAEEGTHHVTGAADARAVARFRVDERGSVRAIEDEDEPAEAEPAGEKALSELFPPQPFKGSPVPEGWDDESR